MNLEPFRPEHGVDEIHQRGHGDKCGQVEHDKASQSIQSRSHAAIRPKNKANITIPRANVARAKVSLLCGVKTGKNKVVRRLSEPDCRRSFNGPKISALVNHVAKIRIKITGTNHAERLDRTTSRFVHQLSSQQFSQTAEREALRMELAGLENFA